MGRYRRQIQKIKKPKTRKHQKQNIQKAFKLSFEREEEDIEPEEIINKSILQQNNFKLD